LVKICVKRKDTSINPISMFYWEHDRNFGKEMNSSKNIGLAKKKSILH
jgi:hypothetical protein